MLLNKIKRFFSSELGICVLIFLIVTVCFYLFSLQYMGPAYISDEIGYLTKATAFSGHSIDGASSWYGGYSIILSPIFFLVGNPFVAWKLVLLVNAMSWGGSFVLLYTILQKLFPKKSKRAILTSVLVSILYPTWISISGYAFSTSVFTFVLMLTVALLIRSKLKKNSLLVLAAILSGFLFWIHPIGIALIISASAMFVYKYVVDRKRVSLLFPLIMISVAGTYFIAVHPWFASIMTPEGFAPQSHYNGFINELAGLSNPRFILNILAQLSALLISTFGLLLLGMGNTIDRVSRLQNKIKEIPKKPDIYIMLVLALTILGSVAIGSIGAASNNSNHIEYWIYTRYAEQYLLMFIGVGVLSAPRSLKLVRLIAVIPIVGLVLYLQTNTVKSIFVNNIVNTQSFWPQYLSSDLTGGQNFLVWFTYGFISISIVFLLMRTKMKPLLFILVLPLIFTSIIQFFQTVRR